MAGQVDKGTWLNEATSKYPATVLGQTAAQRLGVVSPGTKVWIGGNWFTVVGILKPVVLAPELNNAALVGQGAASDLLGARRQADDRLHAQPGRRCPHGAQAAGAVDLAAGPQ